ncbi:cytochrome C assembly family protein [Methylophaga sp. OBS4]|uniref:cytochrome C assembly family protein n=1 Tax=Methylophaga sp. OBS4 TaxID=2991935 RepID=UPI00224FB01A|nr:cytochrome c biogenesis protein CcsA [Methylophaga sp. OBS4]MCX4188563.1 cytochrome c biogenesis protein CcsA [Methylophaga sp. OBS4]
MAIANALAFLLYLSSSVILIRRFVQKDQAAVSTSIPVGILIIMALLFHATDIFFTMKSAGGWNLGLFTTFSLTTWLMALIALLIGARMPNAHPGIVIYPLVALSLILKVGLPSSEPPSLSDPALEWHVLLSLAAYSLFMLAAIQAIILAVQEKQLRQRHAAGLMRKLPPLQSMEAGLFQLIITGFALLTMGLVTGLMFVEDLFAQHLVHKTILSIIAWCVFAALLWGRFRHGWRGKTAVKWTLVGFSFLVFAYMGSKFVLEYLVN